MVLFTSITPVKTETKVMRVNDLTTSVETSAEYLTQNILLLPFAETIVHKSMPNEQLSGTPSHLIL